MRSNKFLTIIISLLVVILSVASFASGKATIVKLGVTDAIGEDLWAPAKEKLKKENIDLQLVKFRDYVTPNNALASKEIDLNSFQHRIFLENEIKTHNYPLQVAGYTFIIPLNLYSNKIKSVDELKNGDSIAIPNDVTNGGRALKVLEAAGIIKLTETAGFNPSVDDIESNPKNIKIVELAANVIPNALPDVTAAIVNGGYALDFGLKTENAVYKDSVLDEERYWNLIAARTEDIQNPEKAAIIEKVIKAYQTPETEELFKNKYDGYFIKTGWDRGLIK